MSQNHQIDPATGDYVVVDGRPVGDNTLATPCYIREKARRKNWLYAPDDQWGADFYLYDKRHLPQDDRALLSVATRAVQPLIDSGRAISTAAELTGTQRSSTEIKLTVVDAAGDPTQLTFSPIRN